jgi:hypothetical protein
LKKVHLWGTFVYNGKERNKITKIHFTKKEQEQLKRNQNGKLPRAIFETAGFDTELIGLERIRSSGKRWRAAYRKDGVEGLQNTRKKIQAVH